MVKRKTTKNKGYYVQHSYSKATRRHFKTKKQADSFARGFKKSVVVKKKK